ncbi:GH1 family beta-glucosidase [Actinomarinicola tropica]|uniref:Beta-glucosidase n=1 Tax=Actinomarinicola tropica TaxID=2789776 RepID=A0A5Q2RP55_9ACTN|nr:GH1 family beta-glucosidase [Actinomarinicola tropica]QGG94985.1 beta-glucosidase [Actinomarinicola tropica]
MTAADEPRPPIPTFPDGFLWGAATSSYQIEGGVDLDGRGPSIWDTFARRPGAIADGTDGSVAVEHRTRMRDDVRLMAELGLGAYRFSIAWPRVQPEGKGAVSTSGLDFYRDLVEALLEVGIVPVATLYHWDLPQALEDAGGWPARDTAGRFADYAEVVGDALGDRVARWSTVNEPWCSAMLGYAAGVHAPGRTDPAAAVAAAHHLLLGHGMGVDALRATVTAADPEIGITLNPYPVHPAGESELDRDAARRVDGIANRIWYDPILRGAYPEDVLDDLRAVSDLAHIRDGDLDVISRPIDAMGLNYYRRHHVRHRRGASASPSPWPGSPDVEAVDPGRPVTDLGWAIEPDGLTETLVDLWRDYDAPPLYVHENGAAFADVVGPDGIVHDADRIDFLDGHLRACAAAIDEGVDLRGYFAWSLLDNYEWAEGYRKRFGVVHVDYDTQVRTPKDSGRWYAEVLRTSREAARRSGG